MSQDHNYRRRRFIKGTGATFIGAGLAGCTGDDGDDADGNDSGQQAGDDGDGGDSGEDIDFPSETVEFMVAYGTGGGYNAYTRMLEPYVMEHLDTNVDSVVNNIEGAGGRIAMNELYNAEGESHKLLLMNVASWVLDQIFEDAEFDLREVTVYPQIADEIRAITVGTNTDVETFDEFAEGVRNGELALTGDGMPDSGSIVTVFTGELSGEWEAPDITETYVPFEGRGEQVSAIMRGDVQIMAGSYTSLLPFIESEELRPVLINIDSEDYPDIIQQQIDNGIHDEVDTLATADVDRASDIQDAVASRRIWGGPPDVPDEQAEIMRDALTQAIQDERFHEDAAEADRIVSYADREESRSAIETQIEAYEDLSDVIEDAWF